jgi:spectinomycin phosphotransferase
MREEPPIARDRIRACLQDHYHITPATIDFLPLGKDSRAGAYRVTNASGISYFLKVTSRSLYKPGCLVPRHLHDQGIAGVVAPIPTRNNALWTAVGDWTMVAYPYVDGELGWATMTDEFWNATGTVLKQIHEVELPASGFDGLRRESFDPSLYASSLEEIEAQLAVSTATATASERTLRASWTRYRPRIRALLSALSQLAAVLRGQASRSVICHADLHPNNLLRKGEGEVYVVDWDDVMLGPRERDFIFVGDPPDHPGLAGAPFYGGYGPWRSIGARLPITVSNGSCRT